jgi:pimeloyl-ACP methyl ester carboxylesterase
MHTRLQDWLSQGSYFAFKDLNIFYRTVGLGPPLLIFHGYPYNGFDFEKIVPSLSQRFRVIIPDMPGMGFSDKPECHRYSFEEMADVYSRLIQELSLSDIHILAHDLGNSVAQELIARDREKANAFTIRSVVFLNGGLFSDVYRPRTIQILLSRSPAFIGKLLSNLMTRKMVLRATDEVFGKDTKPTPDLHDVFWDILNYKRGKSIAYLLGRLVFEKDRHQARWIRAMQETPIPLCFVNGPADPNSGLHMANRYKALIPKGALHLLSAHIGHWPQIEAPEETLGSFYSFHEKLSATTPLAIR